MARKTKSKSRLFTTISLLFTVLSGGGVGAYFNPDWPVLGPLVQKIARHVAEGSRDGPIAKRARQATGEATGGPRTQLAIQPPTSGQGASGQLAASPRPKDKLLIASFNIQVFGKSKMSNRRVVDVLAEVVRQFDIVAIQEIRAKDDDILPRFLDVINADGSRYDFLIGPRLGRTVSTEQYAFVFDTSRIEYDPTSVANMADPDDLLHREPFLTRFRARTDQPDRAFTFWLVNIHTDPDEVSHEVSVLADAFQLMQSTRSNEDDVILLGDLNASEREFGRLGRIPGIAWAVSGAMTNTRRSKAYDNLLFHGQATSEYTGRWGVFDLESSFGLSRAEALKVSDHLPVWAEFDVWEAAPRRNVADRVPRIRR